MVLRTKAKASHVLGKHSTISLSLSYIFCLPTDGDSSLTPFHRQGSELCLLFAPLAEHPLTVQSYCQQLQSGACVSQAFWGHTQAGVSALPTWQTGVPGPVPSPLCTFLSHLGKNVALRGHGKLPLRGHLSSAWHRLAFPTSFCALLALLMPSGMLSPHPFPWKFLPIPSMPASCMASSAQTSF